MAGGTVERRAGQTEIKMSLIPKALREMPPLTLMRMGFSVLWIIVFSYTMYASRDFPGLSGIFPFGISIGGLALALATLILDIRRWRREGHVVADVAGTASTAALTEDGDDVGGVILALKRSARYTLWLLFYLLLIWLVSVVAGSGLFVAAFLAFEGRTSWKAVIIGPVLVMAGLMGLAELMNLVWPDSLFTLL